MLHVLHKYQKTAAMAATGVIGDNSLFLFDYLLRFLRVALLLALWRTLLAGRGPVSGMTLASVLTYTLVAEVFAEPLACRTWLESAFWDGSITTRFLRPIGLFAQFAVEMVGRWMFGFCLFSLPLLLLSPLLGVHPLPASPIAGGLFLLSLTLGVAVGLALEYIFSAIAIGMEWHPYALNSMRAAIGSLLSGALVPLALLPWGLGTALGLLPFAALASAPLRIYTGTGEAWRLIGLQAFWAVVLWPLAHRLWIVNREKMISHGG